MKNIQIGRPISRRTAICGVGGAVAAAGLSSLIQVPMAANAAASGQATGKAGAKTPFVTIGAESGVLGGRARVRSIRPGMAVPKVASLELEASSYALVELKDTGDFVKIKNSTRVKANTIVVRASIPDAPTGGGISATLSLYVNGKFRQGLTLDSKQAWLYRDPVTTQKTKDPRSGWMPYRFYNEFPVWIAGAPIAPGDTIMLRKDSYNTASAYHIDCIDLENVAAPLKQPHNSLSVISYGADPNFRNDSSIAIQKTVDEARKLKRSVWFPPGKYMTNSLAPTPLDFTGVTVKGAGMWHSIIYRNVPLPAPATWRSKTLVGSGTTLTDIQIDSNAILKDRTAGCDYSINAEGAGGWLLDRVWTRHCEANWLSGSNATVQNCRTSDSYGDGFNVNNSNEPNPNKLGYNITVRNNFARGTGDDGFAVFSDAGTTGSSAQVARVKVVNNTSVAPWWANGIRVAGGKDLQICNNVVNGSSSNSAMEIGVFGDTGHPLASAVISGNVLLGGGGWNGERHGVLISSPSATSLFPTAYTNVVLSNNTFRGALRAGISIDRNRDNITLKDNMIDGPANQGIFVKPGVSGTGVLSRTHVKNLHMGQPAFQNDSPATFATTLKNNSWQKR